jgi:hypothetical protein
MADKRSNTSGCSSGVSTGHAPLAPPPPFDPYFGGFGEVMVRDLKLYEALSQSEEGGRR